MNINKPVSTFEAFCGIIADRARTNGDFALLLTEERAGVRGVSRDTRR